MGRGVGQVDFLAGQHEQPLQGAARHGRLRFVHSSGQLVGIALTSTSDVGEDEYGMAVKAIIGTQILQHVFCQRNHPILETLALADDQFPFLAFDVVDGER